MGVGLPAPWGVSVLSPPHPAHSHRPLSPPLCDTPRTAFRTPGFHFGGFLTLSTYAVYLGLASLERRLTGDVHRHGSLQAYAWVSLLAMGGYYCTNWSLNYLNYATRVVWKSCKVGAARFCTVVWYWPHWADDPHGQRSLQAPLTQNHHCPCRCCR